MRIGPPAVDGVWLAPRCECVYLVAIVCWSGVCGCTSLAVVWSVPTRNMRKREATSTPCLRAAVCQHCGAAAAVKKRPGVQHLSVAPPSTLLASSLPAAAAVVPCIGHPSVHCTALHCALRSNPSLKVGAAPQLHLHSFALVPPPRRCCMRDSCARVCARHWMDVCRQTHTCARSQAPPGQPRTLDHTRASSPQIPPQPPLPRLSPSAP